MRKSIHHTLVATKKNNFRPHILKEIGALIVLVIFIGSLFLSYSMSGLAMGKPYFLAEVYPAIITSLTNQGRTESEVGVLKYSLVLETAARNKANDMIAKTYFAHTSPDGRQPWDWIKEAGYEYEYAGENLAINYSESADVYTAWMHSEGHRANILNQHYTEIGVATAKTTVDGKESIIVVQMFGKPKDTAQPKQIVARTTQSEVTEKEVKTNSTTTAVLGAKDIQTSNSKTFVWQLATSPRSASLILYIIFIIILNITVISFGFAEYRHYHKKSIFIALLLVICLSIISLGYLYFTSPIVSL